MGIQSKTTEAWRAKSIQSSTAATANMRWPGVESHLLRRDEEHPDAKPSPLRPVPWRGKGLQQYCTYAVLGVISTRAREEQLTAVETIGVRNNE